MLSANGIGLFHLPVGYPRSVERPITKNNVQGWLKENSNASILKKTSYGTYLGIATALAGIVTNLIGFKKDSNFAKWVGGILGFVGIVATFIGKVFGVDFDLANKIEKIEKRIIFNPPKDHETTPLKEGIAHEEISIPTSDGEKLHGYYLPSPLKTKKTVIFLHGRGNNIGSKNFIDSVKKIQGKIPVNVLMVDFRGFGNSSLNCGKITCDGVIEDAKAMYDYLTNNKGCTPNDISLFGHSLGGAIAVQLANEKKVNSLIIQSSFTSLKDLVKDLLPTNLGNVIPDSWLSFVTSSSDFNSVEAIKTVKANKVCICYGKQDELIPYQHAEDLFNAVTRPKELLILDEAGHSDYARCFTEEQINKLRDMVGVNNICEEDGEEFLIAA